MHYALRKIIGSFPIYSTIFYRFSDKRSDKVFDSLILFFSGK
jgi:hypothetical protein